MLVIIFYAISMYKMLIGLCSGCPDMLSLKKKKIKGSSPKATLKVPGRAFIISSTNIRAVSQATLGTPLRNGVEYIWGFLST